VHALSRERSAQQVKNACAMLSIAPARDDQSWIWLMAQHISKFAKEIRSVILVDNDVVYIPQIHPGLTQAIFDRLRRKSRPVFYAAKAFLLCGSYQLAFAHDRCSGIGVEGVKTKDDHREIDAVIACAQLQSSILEMVEFGRRM
jgi:hypothetical protein